MADDENGGSGQPSRWDMSDFPLYTPEDVDPTALDNLAENMAVLDVGDTQAPLATPPSPPPASITAFRNSLVFLENTFTDEWNVLAHIIDNAMENGGGLYGTNFSLPPPDLAQPPAPPADVSDGLVYDTPDDTRPLPRAPPPSPYVLSTLGTIYEEEIPMVPAINFAPTRQVSLISDGSVNVPIPQRRVTTIVNALPETIYRQELDAGHARMPPEYRDAQLHILSFASVSATDMLGPRMACSITQSISTYGMPTAEQALRFCYYMRSCRFDVFARFEGRQMNLFVFNNSNPNEPDLYWSQDVYNNHIDTNNPYLRKFGQQEYRSEGQRLNALPPGFVVSDGIQARLNQGQAIHSPAEMSADTQRNIHLAEAYANVVRLADDDATTPK